MSKMITTLAEFVNVFTNAKNGGQYATMEVCVPIKLNKFPTDGSEKIRIADEFTPCKEYKVTYHFGEDYERAMAKALGIEKYEAHDSNRIHLVHNLLMQYVSTGNVCAIYLPEQYGESKTTLNGVELNEEQMAYLKRYKPTSHNNSPLQYRTVGIKNVKAITFGGETYEVNFEKEKEVA